MKEHAAYRISGYQVTKEKIAERAGCSGNGWKIISYGYDAAHDYTYIHAERK